MSLLKRRRGSGPTGPTDEYFSSVNLLLIPEGDDGSTTFVDRSPLAKALTVGGTAQIDTAQSKWGGRSILFPTGTANRLTIASPGSDFTFGTGDFTMEAWFRRAGTSNNAYFWMNGTAAGNFQMRLSGTWFQFVIQATSKIGTSGYGVSNTWYHWAYSRNSGTNKVWLNGAQFHNTITDSTNFVAGTASYVGGPGGENFWIGGLRFTKGVGRYPNAFTPPTEQFPTQ